MRASFTTMVAGTFSITVVANAWLRSRSFSARRRSVMSSWVTTQPLPSGVGWLMTGDDAAVGQLHLGVVGSRRLIAFRQLGGVALRIDREERAVGDAGRTSSLHRAAGLHVVGERRYICR